MGVAIDEAGQRVPTDGRELRRAIDGVGAEPSVPHPQVDGTVAVRQQRGAEMVGRHLTILAALPPHHGAAMLSRVELRAGASVVAITPAPGLPMGGYGARKLPSEGTHDPITARILALDDGATRLAFVLCDLVATPPDLVAAVRATVSAGGNLPAANVCVAATHTHSGPILGGRADLVSAAARSIGIGAAEAFAATIPVHLKAHASEVHTAGRNRRHPDGPYDPALEVLVADPGLPAPPVATLLNFACHATVLEWDNLLYSADYPGRAREVVEQATGGAAIFVQGAAGDINPLWLRHDFEEAARIGTIVGAAAAGAVAEARAAGEDQRVINLSWDEALPVAASGAFLAPASLAVASETVELPRRELPSVEELDAVYEPLRAEIDALEPGNSRRRALFPLAAELRMSRARKRSMPASAGDTQRVEVQALRLAEGCAVIALPGEFCVATGRRLRAESGLPWLFVCGYANDYVSYVPPASEFPRHGYEVGCALFEPAAEQMVVESALSLLRKLFREGAP